MSLQACLDEAIAAVRGLVPVRAVDDTYSVEEDGLGRVLSLEEVRHPRVRTIDFRARSWPEDDGETGLRSRRLRVGLALRIYYPLDMDRGYLERMAGEDVGQLSLELPLLVLRATAPAAGMLSIPPPGAPSSREVADDDGRAAGLVVEIPFDLIYLEA